MREGKRLDVEPGTRVRACGQTAPGLYFVDRGWLYLAADSTDGRRHVARIHHTQDLVGMPDLACSQATTDLIALTHAVLYRIDRAVLGRMVAADPRTSALLLTLSARDQLVQADLRCATTQLSSRHQVLFLLLMLLHRERANGGSQGNDFEMPLSQRHMGDLIGLGNVSVSKALVELEQAGMIVRERGRVTVLDVQHSASQVGFVDRFAELDTSWFTMAVVGTASHRNR